MARPKRTDASPLNMHEEIVLTVLQRIHPSALNNAEIRAQAKGHGLELTAIQVVHAVERLRKLHLLDRRHYVEVDPDLPEQLIDRDQWFYFAIEQREVPAAPTSEFKPLKPQRSRIIPVRENGRIIPLKREIGFATVPSQEARDDFKRDR